MSALECPHEQLQVEQVIRVPGIVLQVVGCARCGTTLRVWRALVAPRDAEQPAGAAPPDLRGTDRSVFNP
jgi:hypothetical protein